MELNCKYFIHPSRVSEVLERVYGHIVNKIPAREISVDVVEEEFFNLNEDVISVENLYSQKQLESGKLKGRPTRIRFKRQTLNAITYCEFGYTSLIDLRRALDFLNYRFLGRLTQVRTGFVLKNELIELPIVINETKEFGCFIEIGETFGAIEDIRNLLHQLEFVSGLGESSLVTKSYAELLMKVKQDLGVGG